MTPAGGGGAGRLPAGPVLALAVAAVSWGAILARLCEAPSLAIAFYRMLFAAAALLPWGLARAGAVSARTWGLGAAAGVLLALHFATWIASLALTSVASSVVLVSTQPIFTAALGPLVLGERPRAASWAAIALALAGTALLAGGDWRAGGGALRGDLLAVAGALCASLYLMIGRRLRDRIPFARYLLLVYGVASAALAAAAWAGGVSLSGFPAATWLWLALMAAGPSLLGHGLLNWSVRRVRALTVNLALLGEPLLATIYAAWIFGEIPGGAFYAGGLLIVAGIVLAVREGPRPRV